MYYNTIIYYVIIIYLNVHTFLHTLIGNTNHLHTLFISYSQKYSPTLFVILVICVVSYVTDARSTTATMDKATGKRVLHNIVRRGIYSINSDIAIFDAVARNEIRKQLIADLINALRKYGANIN